MNRNNLSYINSVDHKDHEDRLKDMTSVLKELTIKSAASRRLRYVELDIEGERRQGNLQPDELYIPQHLIDMNIRREQSSYVQYVTQSPRAAICKSMQIPAVEPMLLENDLTNRLRFDGWQIPLYSCIDGFQQNGYGIMEVVYDETKPGHVGMEFVQLQDFAYIADTKDLQECEMVGRSYYFSRTKIVDEVTNGKFDPVQAEMIYEGEPSSNYNDVVIDFRDKSLYKIEKVMFRVNGVVHVAWCCESKCDDWLAKPVPLFIGRRQPYAPEEVQQMQQQSQMTGQPINQKQTQVGKQTYEVDYPYVLFPYLISENDTISQLKGRVYMDQDTQEGASSLMSSFCTAHRRASGLYFCKDTDDPDNEFLLNKNIYFETGALISGKIKQFQLTAPDADVVQAIMTVVSANQNETSQVNFAAQNRKDSRKTATEISAATQSAQSLSTVQVVLFSNSLRQTYQLMFEIIRSRVVAGLIQDVNPEVAQLYALKWAIKPAGDVDVIERQQTIQTMMSAWPVVQQTPASFAYMCDLIQKMFPEQATKYITALQQAQQQQQSAQAQQQQQMMQMAAQLGQGIKNLAGHPEYFSETGRVNAYPKIEDAAQMVDRLEKQQQKQH